MLFKYCQFDKQKCANNYTIKYKLGFPLFYLVDYSFNYLGIWNNFAFPGEFECYRYLHSFIFFSDHLLNVIYGIGQWKSTKLL